MIDTFIKMHRSGVSPIAILQKMTTIPNIQVDTVRAFVDHCHAAKWHLHEQAAKAIVSGFEQHQAHTNIVKQKVYADMEKYGIDVDAIRQKAAPQLAKRHRLSPAKQKSPSVPSHRTQTNPVKRFITIFNSKQ